MSDDDRIWTNAMVLSARDDEIDALEQKLASADARIAELKCSLNHIAAAFDADQEALVERDARIAELEALVEAAYREGFMAHGEECLCWLQSKARAALAKAGADE